MSSSPSTPPPKEAVELGAAAAAAAAATSESSGQEQSGSDELQPAPAQPKPQSRTQSLVSADGSTVSTPPKAVRASSSRVRANPSPRRRPLSSPSLRRVQTNFHSEGEDGERGVLRTQLNASLKFSSVYGAYLLSARIRFLFFFVIELMVVFSCTLAFMISILFSAMLPEARRAEGAEWRATVLLPLGPVVLVLGAWLIDEIGELAADAASPGVLLALRRKFASVVHVWRNRGAVRAVLPAGVTEDDPLAVHDYEGPEVQRSTLVFVDVMVPFFMEVVPVFGAIWSSYAYGGLGAAVVGYLTWGLFTVAVVTLIDFVVDSLVYLRPRYGAAHRWMNETGPCTKLEWEVPPSHADAAPRPSNLGRYLRSDKFWYTRELKRRERREHTAMRRITTLYSMSKMERGRSTSSAAPIAEEDVAAEDNPSSRHEYAAGSDYSDAGSDDDSAAELETMAERVKSRKKGSCWERQKDRYWRCKMWLKRTPWWRRMLVVFGLYLLAAIATEFELITIALGFFLASLALVAFALLVREKVGQVLGAVYAAALVLFFLVGMIMMGTALANMQPSSKLSVNGATVAAPTVPTAGLVPTYHVCRSSWNGFDVVDLALLSELMYSPSDAAFDERMDNVFGGTAVGDWNVVAQNEPDVIVHYKAVEFPAANTTVVTIRGTSTPLEGMYDLMLFAGVAIIQLSSHIVPVSRALPESLTFEIMAALAMPGLSAGPFWHALLRDVERLQADGHNLVLTGHSLGGALAGAIGARLDVQAVAFSSPGLFFNKKRFGVTENAVRSNMVNVVPEWDIVPLVDLQLAAVERIECPRKSPSCHSQVSTLCTLYYNCGDRRGRQFEDYCDKYYLDP